MCHDVSDLKDLLIYHNLKRILPHLTAMLMVEEAGMPSPRRIQFFLSPPPAEVASRVVYCVTESCALHKHHGGIHAAPGAGWKSPSPETRPETKLSAQGKQISYSSYSRWKWFRVTLSVNREKLLVTAWPLLAAHCQLQTARLCKMNSASNVSDPTSVE